MILTITIVETQELVLDHGAIQMLKRVNETTVMPVEHVCLDVLTQILKLKKLLINGKWRCNIE